MQEITKITLSQEEKDFAKRRPSRTVFVGVVNFRGPRGARYRPVRTKACLTCDLAIEAVEKIKGKQYRNNPFPISDEVYEVDFLGRVQA